VSFYATICTAIVAAKHAALESAFVSTKCPAYYATICPSVHATLCAPKYAAIRAAFLESVAAT
jgi:hypothetical protein